MGYWYLMGQLSTEYVHVHITIDLSINITARLHCYIATVLANNTGTYFSYKPFL